jgi:hypothetical protein
MADTDTSKKSTGKIEITKRPIQSTNRPKPTFRERFLGKKDSADEAIQKLDKNLTIIDNLIEHTDFITTTITDLIELINAMKTDDSGYKELIRQKATEVNNAIKRMKTSIYDASRDADKRTTSTILDYNTSTGKSRKISNTRPNEKPDEEEEPDDGQMKIKENVLDELKQKQAAKQAAKPGGNPYKTAKKQFGNLMSYIPGMSRKTQKKHRKHRRH